MNKKLQRILRVSNSLAIAGMFVLIASVFMVPTTYVKPKVNALGVPISGPEGFYEFDRAEQFRHNWPIYLLLVCAAFFLVRAGYLFFRSKQPSPG